MLPLTMIASIALLACGGERIVEVTVQTEIIRTVEVEVPVDVQKEVIREVEKEVPVEIVKEIEVIREVAVEVVKEVEVEKEVQVEVVVTATAVLPPTATPVPAASDAPPSRQAAGELVWAIADSQRNWSGFNAGNLCCAAKALSVVETLFKPVGTNIADNLLAESFEFDSDLTYVDVKVRQGVEFHKGFGPLTAEDVAWSTNDTNPNLSNELGSGQTSVTDGSGTWAGFLGSNPSEALDDSTVRIRWENFGPTMGHLVLWSRRFGRRHRQQEGIYRDGQGLEQRQHRWHRPIRIHQLDPRRPHRVHRVAFALAPSSPDREDHAHLRAG